MTARWAPTRTFEVQGQYQHGRSIDTRTITQDQIAGRPVDAKSLDGFLFDTIGGRVTVEALRGLRVWGGYYQDKNNRDDITSSRWLFGASAMNVFQTGLDLTATDSRTNRPGSSSYDAWYFSLGRSLGSRLYLTLDYSTSLSVLQLTDSGGLTVREPAVVTALQPVGNLERLAGVLGHRDGRAAGRRHGETEQRPAGADVPF